MSSQIQLQRPRSDTSLSAQIKAVKCCVPDNALRLEFCEHKSENFRS